MKHISIDIKALMGILTIISIQTSASSQTTSQVQSSSSIPSRDVTQQISSLTVGQAMPNVAFGKLLNYPDGNYSLTSFNGKLVIIDFFATYCASCVDALPRFDSLQATFRDKVQFLLVTDETEEKVTKIFKKLPILKNLQLPVLVSDSVLSKLFPHFLISHEIWVNPAGKIQAITGADYVTETNINNFLVDSTLRLPVKNDFIEFQYDQTLLTFNKNTLANVQPTPTFYSVLTPYIDNAGSFFKWTVDSAQGVVRLLITNFPVLRILLATYRETYHKTPFEFPSSYVSLNLNDRHLFVPDSPNWSLMNTYCYETVFPIKTSEDLLMKKMRSELEIYFHLKTSFEKRKVKCMILTKDGNSVEESKILTRSINSKKFNYPINANQYAIPINDLINQLNRRNYDLPFIDNSGFSEGSYLLISKDSYYDISKLNNDLKKFGLKLMEEDRDIRMFIIKSD